MDPVARSEGSPDEAVGVVTVRAHSAKAFVLGAAHAPPAEASAAGSELARPAGASRPGMTRRTAILLGAAVGAAAIYAKLSSPASSTRMARRSDLEAFAQAHLRLEPDLLQRVGVWARSPEGPWNQRSPEFKIGDLHARVWDPIVTQQFREGRMVIAQGWILSEHEVAFCAALAEGR